MTVSPRQSPRVLFGRVEPRPLPTLTESEMPPDAKSPLTLKEAAIILQSAWRGYQVRGKAKYGYHPIYATPQKRGRLEKPIGYMQYEKVSDTRGTTLSVKTILPNPDIPFSTTERAKRRGTYWSICNRTDRAPLKDYISLVGLLPPAPMKPEVKAAISDLEYVVIPHRVDGHTVIAEQMDGNVQEINPDSHPQSLQAYKGVLHDLKILHQRGLIHRDLKPENFLIKDGVVKLGDLDSLAFRDDLHPAKPTLSLLDATSRYLYDRQDGAFLEHYKKYGKACDDFSMLLALMEVTGYKKTALAIKMDQVLYGVKKKAGQTPDMFDQCLHKTAEIVAGHWIHKYVKKEFRAPVAKLVSDVVAFHKEYGDTMHLYDLLIV